MAKLVSLTHRNVYVQTFMLFTQLSEATIKYMDNVFYRELRMSYVKYAVLRSLVRSGQPLKHSELAAFTGTKKHNITALVDRMKKEKLVSTRWSQKDKRVNNVLITEKGRKLYAEANPLARKMLEKLLHGMTQKDVKEASRLLNIIKENLEQE